VHTGYESDSQGGVHVVHINRTKGIDQDNKSKSNSSSSIADDDDDRQPRNKQEKTISRKPSEKSWKDLTVREKEVNTLLLRRGKDFINDAHRFADEIVKRGIESGEIVHYLPYKLRILESILAGNRQDFIAYCKRRYNVKLIDLNFDDLKRKKLDAFIKKNNSVEKYLERFFSDCFDSSSHGLDLDEARQVIKTILQYEKITKIKDLIIFCKKELEQDRKTESQKIEEVNFN
jgi:hypothetical protein